MSSEPLREMLSQYESVTRSLNEAIDKATKANNELAIAKAEVAKNTHLKDLIKEQIMCEKKLIGALNEGR